MKANQTTIWTGHPEDYDPQRAVRLNDARKLIRGRIGKHLSLVHLRRFINPKRGYRADDGTTIILRTTRVQNEIFTMPEWCHEFDRLRGLHSMRGPAMADLVASMPTPRQQARANAEASKLAHELLYGKKKAQEPAAVG